MTQHILVTGGAGYIGSHCAATLKQAGYIPVVIDNLSTGHAWAAKFGPFVQCDIADSAAVAAACAQYKPTAILHLAGFSVVSEGEANPAMYWENNCDKAKVFFDTLGKAGVHNAIISSTAAVYGLPASSGMIDEDTPLQPINVYGKTKVALERIVRDAGMNAVMLRYFNAAGADAANDIGEAHIPETHLIPSILLGTLGIKPPVKIMGTDYPTPDGTCVRDYVHVVDLANGHLRALHHLLQGGAGAICNLGSGRGYSVNEIVAAVEKRLGRQIDKMFGPRRAGDPPRLVAGIERAKSLLGWQPEYAIDAIIASVIEWHDSDTYVKALAIKTAQSVATPA